MTPATTPPAEGSTAALPRISKGALWGGRIMSYIPVLMLLVSAGTKLAKVKPLEEGFKHLGLSLDLAVGLGVVELLCTILYLIPRTAVLGAILLTGYLGGAIYATLRVGDQFIGAFIFGVMLWGGLYLRDPRIRALIPLRSKM